MFDLKMEQVNTFEKIWDMEAAHLDGRKNGITLNFK
jgi:hypothetical protein